MSFSRSFKYNEVWGLRALSFSRVNKIKTSRLWNRLRACALQTFACKLRRDCLDALHSVSDSRHRSILHMTRHTLFPDIAMSVHNRVSVAIKLNLSLIYSHFILIPKQRSQLFEGHVAGVWIPDPDDDAADESQEDEEEVEAPAYGPAVRSAATREMCVCAVDADLRKCNWCDLSVHDIRERQY